MKFIGREEELKELRRLINHDTANLVVLQGRRRIGKSRLIEHFAQGYEFYSFAGVAPQKGITAAMQRQEFSRQLCEQFKLPNIRFDDWGDIFTFLSKNIPKQKTVILFDEISWMGSLDPMFRGKLKNAWDKQFKKNTNLMLVLCGSVSTWIEKNIISSTLFLGRPTCYMRLKELSLTECNEFWGRYKNRISSYEKFKILSIIGGIPKYLEMVNVAQSAEFNIRTLCFTPNAPLLDEFERIFSDIFGKRSELYKEIIEILVNGSASQEAILELLGRSKSGEISEYLKDLELAGFVSRDYTLNIKSKNISKLSHYRLKDNYVRFYLKYVKPNKSRINKDIYQSASLSALPGWDTIASLQFENLVVNHHTKIIEILNIPLTDVIFSSPYFQRKTKRVEGCQIDLLILTRFNIVYVCEIKYSRKPINNSVVKEVQEKINKVQLPKHYSYLPVLIHVNEIDEDVTDSNFFAKIINFGDLLGGV